MKDSSYPRIGSPVYQDDTPNIIGFVHKIVKKTKSMDIVLFYPTDSNIIKCPFINKEIPENETWDSMFNNITQSMDDEVLQFWKNVIINEND